jgi:uncharacterized membrane protein YuzA (DUF378 family)
LIEGSCSLLQAAPDVNVTALEKSLGALETRVGKDSNSDGEAECGLLGQAACTPVNARYNAVVNVLCGEVFQSISGLFELLVGLAVAMAMAEFIRRFVSGTVEEENDFM